MAHRICRVKAFSQIGPFTLQISFDDGASRTIDFEPVLRGELYGPLADSTLFSKVKLDSDFGTLVWPNGADFDPATLYDWPNISSQFIAQAQRWSTTSNVAGQAAT